MIDLVKEEVEALISMLKKLIDYFEGTPSAVEFYENCLRRAESAVKLEEIADIHIDLFEYNKMHDSPPQ